MAFDANNMVRFTKAIASSGTAIALSSTKLLVRWFAVTAKKVGAVNAGTIYIGDSTVDVTSPQGLALAAGDYWEPQLPPGTVVDLSQIYIDGATADGVVGVYIPAETT